MPIEDGLYLIHSSGEHIRNYYPVVEYDGQQITTISGASTLPPTEVSCASSSSSFFFVAPCSSVWVNDLLWYSGRYNDILKVTPTRSQPKGLE